MAGFNGSLPVETTTIIFMSSLYVRKDTFDRNFCPTSKTATVFTFPSSSLHYVLPMGLGIVFACQIDHHA